jgi:hypothetical protein
MVDLYRAITLSLTILALITWLVWLIRHPKKWGYAVWIIIWLLNIMAFYASILLFGVTDPKLLNSWSTIIRWQALISILGAAILWWNGNPKHPDRVDYV